MPRMPPTTDDLAEADDELWSALLHGDADAIEAIADPDVSIDLDPFAAHAMDELAAALRTGRLRVEAVDLERRRLRITGELATTDAVATVTGTHGGAPFKARLRWIRTWRLEAAWVLIAASSSPLRERG